jgi:hypothetical protein
MPFGSGLGTFVPVYAMFEKPKDAMVEIYANHAHNDFVELWLTTGAIGITLAAMALAWLALRTVQIWRSAPPEGASDLDWDLARAATLVVGLLIAHSVLDYPLRTGAIMAVVAFCCALMVEPPRETIQPRSKSAEPVRPTPVKKTQLPEMPASAPPSLPVPQPAPTPEATMPVPDTGVSSEAGKLSPDRQWGADIEWPEEWSSLESSGNIDERSSNATKPLKGPKKT